MCLVLLALDRAPGYPLVVGANREELHERPAAPLHWWPERPDMAAGRDRLAGGTWLGVRRDGRFATVLNAPGSGPPGPRSRGELVPGFLEARDPASAARAIGQARDRYAGFHFLGVAGRRGWYLGPETARPIELRPGLHGVDRDGLDSDSPRLAHALERFPGVLADVHAEPLLGLLADRAPPAGAGDAGRPVFLCGERFGTRCSTVLRVGSAGGVELIERRFGPNGRQEGETRLTWQAQAVVAARE